MRKLNRRTFIKLGAGAAAALAGAGYAYRGVYLENTDPNQYRHGWSVGTPETEKYRKVIQSTCLQCSARCGIIGYVEKGKLVKIEGNPFHPNNRGKICSKGLAGINPLYDQDRILYPLKRTGKRGEGKWKRITWDEAYAEVASRLKALREGGRAEELYFQLGRDGDVEFSRRFCYAFGGRIIGGSSFCTSSRSLGLEVTWGAEDDFKDVANSRYILNFGVNFYEAHPEHLSLVQRVIEARINNRAKLVTIEPRLSNTAGRSDEWFPIKPGTDGIVALAMAGVIVQRGLYDKSFVEKWVNYPVKKLEEHLRQYTPAKAEEVSGMPAQDIIRIAEEFANYGPALTLCYKGATSQYNGTYNTRCIFLLDILTGNIGVKGGTCYPAQFSIPSVEPSPRANPSPVEAYKFFSELKDGRRKVGIYLTYYTNPAFSFPDTNVIIELLKDESLIPYFIAIDAFMSETTALADLVLPDVTYLERWELETAKTYDGVPFLSLRQPLVEPKGEAVSFRDICIELSRRTGGGMEKYFQFVSSKDYVRVQCSSIKGLVKSGGLEYLAQNSVWVDPEAEAEFNPHEKELSLQELKGSVNEPASGVIYKDDKAIGIWMGSLPFRGFNTPSRKLEVYSKELKDRGFAPLPVFELVDELQKIAEEEFILTTFKWNVHTNSRTANCKWLSETVQVNPIWINKTAAIRMGIDYGDEVEVASKIGKVTGKAFLTEGIHPKTIAISASCGHGWYGRIAQAKKFESEDLDTQQLWWKENGLNPNKIIPISCDPLGGALSWAAVVKVKKI